MEKDPLMSLFGALRLPRSILFGSGQRRALGAVAAQFGRRVLICTDTRLGADPEFKALASDLEQRGLTTLIYDRTRADLPTESVVDCVSEAASFAPQVIIGIGGGSVPNSAVSVFRSPPRSITISTRSLA